MRKALVSSSNQSHVLHLTPAMVVTVGSIVILCVVRGLDSELGVIRVVRVKLELALQCAHMLTVNLVGPRPEDTLPDHSSFGVLETGMVFIVYRLRRHCKVKVSDVKPEACS